ncbi:hypothetical protein ACA910_013498 [Epithemia clementina (nom. ined.)]
MTSTNARRDPALGSNLLPAIRSGLRSTFLPSGYPNKIPRGYLRYAVWSWIQDLSTQLRGVLATQRVLEGVGVGRPGATALSAMLNFLVRDGCGMAATLLFTASAASRFQSDVKRWRLFADIMVDIGITLEVAAAQVPLSFFLPMICVGNMCKAMCGVAAGAVGGSINLYWAAQGTDISDISAKFGAQHTVTATLGLIFAAIFARSIADVPLTTVWILYSALTILHILANIRCMRIIAFQVMNAARVRMIFHEFWQQYKENVAQTQSANRAIHLSSPDEIASREPLFFLPRSFVPSGKGPKILFGVPFNDVVDLNQTSSMLQDANDTLSWLQRPYWLCLSSDRKDWGHFQSINVALNADATPRQRIQAYFAALVFSEKLKDEKSSVVDKSSELVHNEQNEPWNAFCRACENAGWDMDSSNIASRGYEVTIDIQN